MRTPRLRGEYAASWCQSIPAAIALLPTEGLALFLLWRSACTFLLFSVGAPRIHTMGHERAAVAKRLGREAVGYIALVMGSSLLGAQPTAGTITSHSLPRGVNSAAVIDPAGNVYLAGAVDSAGNPCVSGSTGGSLPTTSNAAIPAALDSSIFVAKLSADGSRFAYVTYLPATLATASAIAVDTQRAAKRQDPFHQPTAPSRR